MYGDRGRRERYDREEVMCIDRVSERCVEIDVFIYSCIFKVGERCI